jgi:hypothetical protein
VGEGALVHSHDEVDWIEVSFASEASSQVGFWIGSGIEFATIRTQEPQESFSML